MGESRQLEVRPVTTNRHWRDFHAIKDRIYRDDSCYVRTLNFQRLGQLDEKRNPFYGHAERAAFICWEGNRPMGRIVAIVDRLHQQHYDDRVGFFGFFECPEDPAIAQKLVLAAAQWLSAHGCDQIRGPVNPSMKSDFGVLVEGNQFSPYVMMAHTPRFYHELLLQCGFDVVRSFVALALHASDDRQAFRHKWDEYETLCQRIRDRYPEIKIRIARKSHIEEDIRRINELGDQIRSVGWGFVPFTPAELDHVVAQLKRILRPEMTFLAEIDNQIIGYVMAMPDLNWVLQKTIGRWDWLRMPQVPYLLSQSPRLRIFGLGVIPKYRHSGLAGLLIKRMYDDWGEKYRAWELSWVDTENIRSIRSIQGFIPVEIYKKYHLYQRPLAASGRDTNG